MKGFLTASAVSLALVLAPTAQAAAPVRAAAPMSDESEMGGGLPISALIVLIAVIAGGIYLVVDGDDDPDSP
jgi:hypothetical protein